MSNERKTLTLKRREAPAEGAEGTPHKKPVRTSAFGAIARTAPPPKKAETEPKKDYRRPLTAEELAERERRKKLRAQGIDVPNRAPHGERPPRSDRRPKPFAEGPRPKPVQVRNLDAVGVRVSKLMAERGLCSRREADTYIERGWVWVNGERVTELGVRVDPSAEIVLDKHAKAVQQRQVTILLHKPVGYVSGQPEPGFKPAVVLVLPENHWQDDSAQKFSAMHLRGLAPAGRLDVDSTGLLVMTQDGRVARQLIGEDSLVDKEYLVRVEGEMVPNGLALLNHGLSLDGYKLKPAKVEWLNDDQLRFVLNEGRKRQIRRMCELVGLKVVGLKRVRIGKIRLGDLPVGQWRYLREDETF